MSSSKETTKSSSFPTWTFDKACQTMEWSELSTVRLSVDSTSLDETNLTVIAVQVDDTESKPFLTGWAAAVDKGLHGALENIIINECCDNKAFTKLGAVTPTIRIIEDGKSKRYVVFSLGKKSDDVLPPTYGYSIGKAIASICIGEKKIITASIHFPDDSTICTDTKTLRDLSTAFYEELHVDNRYRTGDKIKKVAEDLKEVRLVCAPITSANVTIEQGKQLALGVLMARDIVNAPHNVLNSESLADTAKRIAKESNNGCLTCHILDKKDCEELNMGAYLGVARGSETQPQFIHITYKPPNSSNIKRKVGVVGKGLLFDTGGYNIKVAMMELMKFDCGGAAAVLGAARSISMIQPSNVEVHFIIAACENMINERAYVPSDILTASNGKTIEVLNTDAEGRLTLADALVYADSTCQCEKIIELSTLTGTCMAALGKEISAILTHNDELATELLDVSKITGEKIWRMPMAKEYNEQLDSKIADIKNIGTRWGGLITAGLFLQNFVNEEKPFAHLDIAGPVWSDKLGVATGYGPKLITEWVTRQGK